MEVRGDLYFLFFANFWRVCQDEKTYCNPR